jgi:ribosomal protein L11 methyltransferase
MTSESRIKIWHTIRITADRAAGEAIDFALLESGALGTETSTFGKDKDAEVVTIVGYFEEQIDLRGKLDEALEIYSLPGDAIKNIEWAAIEQQDWLAEWKKNWQPVESGRFIVAPIWKDVGGGDDKIVIRIEPGMAFGTGTHETTRLCLKAIGENYRGGSFLDVGTGTAVLAIAAAKMFPGTEIEACDIDADSVVIASENAELNNVHGIEFYEGSINGETKIFDLICANLTADVILPILPLLVEKSKKALILSGILAEQEELVVEALKKLTGDKYIVDRLGEWISITVSRGE